MNKEYYINLKNFWEVYSKHNNIAMQHFSTLSSQLITAFKANMPNKVDPADKTEDKYLNAILKAGALLDDGNSDEGIDSYPADGRALFIRAKYKVDLLKRGALLLGGSNTAQRMIAQGGLSDEAKPNNTTGYYGDIDGTPVYVVAGTTWKLIEQYLGAPTAH